MQHFSIKDFSLWERYYRANVISGLSGYKPVMLVGTQNSSGFPNLSLFQNIIHLGANPALIGMLSRPREASPHTLANIETSGWFTLNSVQASFIEKAHQTAAKYDERTSEFEAVGFTMQQRPGIDAPFVAESVLQVALKVEQIIPISLNHTWFIIGSVQHFFIVEGLIEDDGHIALGKERVVCTGGLDGYYLPELINRFAHPKPGKPITPIQ